MAMASWLELVLNIIGYGGFVVIASCHHGPEAVSTASDGLSGDAVGPGRDPP